MFRQLPSHFSNANLLSSHQRQLLILRRHIFTMADKLAFLLFGDQSTDTHGFLAEFFRQPSRGLLANAFLEQVGRALRKEIEALPRLERAKIPKFLSLQNLNERYHAQSLKHPGLDGALLCVSQLAHYIELVIALTRRAHTSD